MKQLNSLTICKTVLKTTTSVARRPLSGSISTFLSRKVRSRTIPVSVAQSLHSSSFLRRAELSSSCPTCKPKGKVKPGLSLSQIVDAVSEKLGVPVKFAPDCQKADELAAALKPGEVLLLENLRYYPEEEGKPVGIDKEDPAYEEAKKAMKASQKEFAKKLASYADCWVMEIGRAHV